MSRRFGQHDDLPFADESPVDWGRVGVSGRAGDNTGASDTTLGDATRWGSQERFQVGESVGFVASPQLVRVQTEDPYARNWQLLGNVNAPVAFWELSNGQWTLGLEITMGVGQGAIIQTVKLRPLIDLCADWYIDAGDGGDGGYLSKSWVMCGGVMGRAISVRVVSRMQDTAFGEQKFPVTVSAMLSPYSVGV
jgi:hypothetical protein